MLNNQDEIDSFRQFQSAGGLAEVPSLIIGRQVNTESTALSTDLSDCISSEINYSEAGISGLIAIINDLSGEAAAAATDGINWCSYIETASEPTDLEIVAQGVDVIRKLSGDTSGDPAPSIVPVVDEVIINELLTSVQTVAAEEPALSSLMSQINTAITPVEPPDDGSGMPVTPIQPSLSPELKAQADAMQAHLETFNALIEDSAMNVYTATTTATAERLEALEAFEQCVSFTLTENQKSNPLVADAANKISP